MNEHNVTVSELRTLWTNTLKDYSHPVTGWQHSSIEFCELEALSRHDHDPLLTPHRFLDWQNSSTGGLRQGIHHHAGVSFENAVRASLRNNDNCLFILLFPDKACALSMRAGHRMIFCDPHAQKRPQPNSLRRVKTGSAMCVASGEEACDQLVKYIVDGHYLSLGYGRNHAMYMKLRLREQASVVTNSLPADHTLLRTCQHGRIVLKSYHPLRCACDAREHHATAAACTAAHATAAACASAHSTAAACAASHSTVSACAVTTPTKPWRSSSWPTLPSGASFAQKFSQRLGEKIAWRLQGGNGGPRVGHNVWPVFDSLSMLYDPSNWRTQLTEENVRAALTILVNAQPIRAIAATRPCGVTLPDLTEAQVLTYQNKIKNKALTDLDKQNLIDRLVASWRSAFVVGTPSLDPVTDAKSRPPNRIIDPLAKGVDLCRYFQILSEIHPGGSAFLWFGAEYLSWVPTNVLPETMFAHLKIVLPTTRMGASEKAAADSWICRDAVKRKANELGGGQFALSIASRNLANEMAKIKSVQLAMRDPTGSAGRDTSDSIRMESIVNEIQMMESIAVADDDHGDDQQLVFREMIVGGSQLRTNDWPSKPRGPRATFAGKWAIFRMLNGTHTTVHWVVPGETMMGLSCLTGVSIKNLFNHNKHNHELTSLRQRGIDDDAFTITSLPAKTLIVVWVTSSNEEPHQPPIFDGRWTTFQIPTERESTSADHDDNHDSTSADDDSDDDNMNADDEITSANDDDSTSADNDDDNTNACDDDDDDSTTATAGAMTSTSNMTAATTAVITTANAATTESDETLLPNPSPPHDYDDCPFQNGDKVVSRYRGTDGNQLSRSRHPGVILHTYRSGRGFDFDVFFDDNYIEKIELVTKHSGVINIKAV